MTTPSVTPPHNLDAETAVLGSILLDAGAIARVVDLLDADDFYRENHASVYRAALGLYRAGEPIDNLTLSAELERLGLLERIGGRSGLAMLQEAVPTAAHVEHYAAEVRRYADDRRLIAAGLEAIRVGQLAPGEDGERPAAAARLAELVNARQRWQPPVPLAAVHQLPAFPLAALPAWLGRYVEAVADATQTPPDLGGMLALAALAACAAGRVRLEVRPGWTEPLNLFVAVALPPGERKSAVFETVTAPLADFEASMAAERAYEIAAARARRKVAEKALERAQTAAASAMGAERERRMADVDNAARDLEDAIVPAEYRLLADDATPEVTASLLAEQGGRIAIMSPEGGVFGHMAGRYSGGQPNLDVYLKGHAGDRLRVDRKSRAAEYIPRPALTIGLAPQPDVLRSLGDQPGFRGVGLLARFLYSLPASRVGGRRVDVAPLPAVVRDAYAVELLTLARSLDAVVGTHVLQLGRVAEAELLTWMERLEPRLGEHGDLGQIADWGSKLPGAVARLAGLLHLAGNIRGRWGEPLAPEPLKAAIAIGDYLIPHAMVAFDLMEADTNLGLARRSVEWMVSKGLHSFTKRDCFEALKSRLRGGRVAALDPVLALLEVHGFVRRRAVAEDRGRGRPPSPVFDVNPLSAQIAVIAQIPAEPISAITANSALRSLSQPPDDGPDDDWERIA